MILLYCHGSPLGITLLKLNASRNCSLSQYSLGIILRDSDELQSKYYLQKACDAGSPAAKRELHPSQKASNDSPNMPASRLTTKYNSFYPPSLSCFIRKHFAVSKGLINVNTSHCWNPHCGRWSIKKPIGEDLLSLAEFLPPLEFNHYPRILSIVTKIRKENGIDDPLCVDEFIGSCSISRMQMCSHCRKAKYCSKQCQVYDWVHGQHRMECTHLQEE